MTVDYSDEVTPEQVKYIDKLLADEFATGHWVIIESESPVLWIEFRVS